MVSENKAELFDFEKAEETTNKENKKTGKKASTAAMAGAAAVAGGATAVGAEAAMSLADEEIIDPEMVNEAIAGSTVEPVHQVHNHAPAQHVAPSDAHFERVEAAAQEVSGGDAEEDVQVEAGEEVALDDSAAPAPLAEDEVVEILDIDPADITDEDVAMIIDDEMMVEHDDVPGPLVESFDGDAGILLSDATDTDINGEDFLGDIEPTCIDDLLV